MVKSDFLKYLFSIIIYASIVILIGAIVISLYYPILYNAFLVVASLLLVYSILFQFLSIWSSSKSAGFFGRIYTVGVFFKIVLYSIAVVSLINIFPQARKEVILLFLFTYVFFYVFDLFYSYKFFKKAK